MEQPQKGEFGVKFGFPSAAGWGWREFWGVGERGVIKSAREMFEILQVQPQKNPVERGREEKKTKINFKKPQTPRSLKMQMTRAAECPRSAVIAEFSGSISQR